MLWHSQRVATSALSSSKKCKHFRPLFKLSKIKYNYLCTYNRWCNIIRSVRTICFFFHFINFLLCLICDEFYCLYCIKILLNGVTALVMELGKFKNTIESLSPDTHTYTRLKKSTKSEKKFNIVYLIFRSRKLSTQSTKLPDYLQPIAGHTRHIDMSLNWAHSLFWKNLVIPSPDFYFYTHLPYFHSLSEITTQRRYEIKPNCAQYDSDHHISFFFTFSHLCHHAHWINDLCMCPSAPEDYLVLSVEKSRV